jgi:hypothetical protein
MYKRLSPKIILTVQCISLAFGFQSVWAATTESISSKHPRWYTVDSSAKAEYRQKERTLARIDEFWAEFKKVEPKLRCLNFDKNKKGIDFQSDWISKQTIKVHPDLMWELGPGHGKGTYKLDFSVVGHDDLTYIAKTMVQRAPKVPRWSFSAYKRPVPFNDVNMMYKMRGHIGNAPEFHADFSLGKDNLIDVTVTTPAATGDAKKNAAIILLLSDVILGEENSDIWLGQFIAKKTKPLPKFDYETASKRFANDFYAKQKELLASLPSVPYYKLEKFGTFGLFTLPLDLGFTRQTISTSADKLCHALVYSRRFHSKRFSKFDEKFVYLQIPEAGENSTFVERRGKLEDALNAELKKAQLGCVFAGGWGPPDTGYIDLCVTNVDRAIPLIRTVCRKFNLSHKTNLRFYDCDWLYEWVGMYDDTPVPGDIERPWFNNES